jgi:hypothetical protein
MPTIAFLFRGDDFNAGDSDLVCEVVFRTVFGTAHDATFHLRSGGILLHRFSERITALSRETVSGRSNVGLTVSDDKKLRATLAVAFADSVAAGYHHLQTTDLSRELLTAPVECVAASDIDLGCASQIHNDLKTKLLSYLGMFEVDRGDPMSLELAANGLIPFCVYKGGDLEWIFPMDDQPSNEFRIPWAEKLPFKAIRITPSDPDVVPREQLSIRGRKNLRLLKQRGHSHAENVLRAFYDSLRGQNDPAEIQIEFGKEEFGKGYADVRKLRDYCLNDQHTDAKGNPGKGRHKAFMFRRVLGLTRNDWRFLGEQLVAGLEPGRVKTVRQSEYGIQYSVIVPVIGRNGLTKSVTSAWIIRPGFSPSLASAYLSDDADTTEPSPLAHLLVATANAPNYWDRLYETARQHGEKTAKDWVPTPMWVEGFDGAIAEGVCGTAWVRLPDARSSFSRWLKKKELGDSGHKTSLLIFATTTSQSLELAKKYCEGFAQVLRLNGIDCEVESRED